MMVYLLWFLPSSILEPIGVWHNADGFTFSPPFIINDSPAKDMKTHKNIEATKILHEKLFVRFVFLWLF